jgi:hypothetical protein
MSYGYKTPDEAFKRSLELRGFIDTCKYVYTRGEFSGIRCNRPLRLTQSFGYCEQCSRKMTAMQRIAEIKAQNNMKI